MRAKKLLPVQVEDPFEIIQLWADGKLLEKLNEDPLGIDIHEIE